MTHKATLATALVASIATQVSATAQEPQTPQETKSLQPVTTIAAKIPTPIEQAPGNTSIINKHDIAIRPNYRFTDTLRGHEGVLQPKGRGMETFDGAMIRGINNGALLMVDGVILNDINNNTKMLTTMRAHDLERVEITRGASSALYGSGALSGAINFITAMPDSLSVYGSLGYGNPFSQNGAPENLTNWYLSVGDSFFDKSLRVKATYGGSFSSGYAADNAWVNASGDNGIGGLSGSVPSHKTDGTPIVLVGDMGRQRYATHDAKIKAQADIGSSGVLDAWVQYSSYNYIHHRQQSFLRDENGNVAWGNATSPNSTQGSAPYAFVGGMGNEIYNQVISALSYTHYFGSNEWRTSLNHTYGNDIWAGPSGGASPFGGAGSKQDHHYNTLNVESTFTLRLSQAHSLLFGVQERYSGYKQNAYNLSDWRDFASSTALSKTITGTHNFLGVFVHYQAAWSKYFSTGLSGRWDLWQGFNYTDTTKPNAPNATHNQFSPKLSLNFTPFSSDYATTIIKASGGSSFRAPTFNQKFRDYIRNDGVQTSGNPHLKPEELYSYDIGLEQSLYPESTFAAQLKLYYFDSFFTNAITTIGKNLENAQKARINGIELSYRQKLFGYGGLFASYTLYNAKLTQDLISGSQVIAAGNRLPGVPEHSGYVQLYYDDGRLFGSLSCEMASKRYKDLDNASQKVWGVYSSSDAYYLLDMRLGYRFQHLELSANFTNLLDYQYYAYYRAPGRAFYLEVASRF
ncbi:TonB-dependent receptor [Helicobacter canis]|uniref:TonB-dependent receptor n=1 Tax=Helicobacter canis TaxID=29419 RepID=A0A377J342_9HELI|nr:TonB-dependent receptor [Helicobacter canis]STO96922.1 TonB-dependent receptor [Helicobacter canis]